jgi:hypothetical protein
VIRIEKDALYTRADLAAMLGPAGVDVDYFISRVKPRKFLRMVWLGEDLLAAMRAAPNLVEREAGAGSAAVLEAIAAAVPAPVGPRTVRHRPERDDPSAALKRLRRQLRERDAR